MRFVWEVSPGEWNQTVRQRRWVPFEKGGGYGKWFGHHFWAVDWEHDGARIKAFPRSYIRNEEHYFQEGWTYSYMARGSLGARWHSSSIFAHKSPGMFPRDSTVRLAAIANCRSASVITRAISASIQLPEGCVSRVPYIEPHVNWLSALEVNCVDLKRLLVILDPTERSFNAPVVRASSLADAYTSTTEQAEAIAAVLHTLEGISEHEVFTAYGLASDDLAAVLDETGTPAGWYPVLTGYDELPPLPEGTVVAPELLTPLANESRRHLDGRELAILKRRLRALYEAGPGGKAEAEEPENNDEEEDEETAPGARIPIPPETFLEQLAQKVEIHPVSVFWLLRELRSGGVVSLPERRRWTEDYISVLVLRLLGHRWPREIEENCSAPGWQECDGIIPLVDGTGKPPLIARLRERLAEDFGPERVNSTEAEFAAIIGKSLTEWLSTEFFACHISNGQFRRRPIAWQLESDSGAKGKGVRGRRRQSPAFSCLVYYHRLDRDLLPKLRSQYIGPLRSRFETELGGLERISDPTDEQNRRRDVLLDALDELREFEARLESIIVSGFECDRLRATVKDEPFDRWTALDDDARPPASGSFSFNRR